VVRLLALRTERLGNFIVEYNQVLEAAGSRILLVVFSILRHFLACTIYFTKYVILALVMCFSGTFIGAFAKFRKAPVICVMPVCPSDYPHWTYFHEINIYDFYENLSRKSKFC
jgi:hypothetical protein